MSASASALTSGSHGGTSASSAAILSNINNLTTGASNLNAFVGSYYSNELLNDSTMTEACALLMSEKDYFCESSPAVAKAQSSSSSDKNNKSNPPLPPSDDDSTKSDLQKLHTLYKRCLSRANVAMAKKDSVASSDVAAPGMKQQHSSQPTSRHARNSKVSSISGKSGGGTHRPLRGTGLNQASSLSSTAGGGHNEVGGLPPLPFTKAEASSFGRGNAGGMGKMRHGQQHHSSPPAPAAAMASSRTTSSLSGVGRGEAVSADAGEVTSAPPPSALNFLAALNNKTSESQTGNTATTNKSSSRKRPSSAVSDPSFSSFVKQKTRPSPLSRTQDLDASVDDGDVDEGEDDPNKIDVVANQRGQEVKDMPPPPARLHGRKSSTSASNMSRPRSWSTSSNQSASSGSAAAELSPLDASATVKKANDETSSSPPLPTSATPSKHSPSPKAGRPKISSMSSVSGISKDDANKGNIHKSSSPSPPPPPLSTPDSHIRKRKVRSSRHTSTNSTMLTPASTSVDKQSRTNARMSSTPSPPQNKKKRRANPGNISPTSFTGMDNSSTSGSGRPRRSTRGASSESAVKKIVQNETLQEKAISKDKKSFHVGDDVTVLLEDGKHYRGIVTDVNEFDLDDEETAMKYSVEFDNGERLDDLDSYMISDFEGDDEDEFEKEEKDHGEHDYSEDDVQEKK